MYLNIGKTKIINEKDIIGVFDLDITSQSHITRNFLKAAEKRGEVENTAEDIPKSFVICTEGKEKLYLCQPAAKTLAKRVESENI